MLRLPSVFLIDLLGDEEMPAKCFGFLENGADVFSLQFIVKLTFVGIERICKSGPKAFIADVGGKFEHAVDVAMGRDQSIGVHRIKIHVGW